MLTQHILQPTPAPRRLRTMHSDLTLGVDIWVECRKTFWRLVGWRHCWCRAALAGDWFPSYNMTEAAATSNQESAGPLLTRTDRPVVDIGSGLAPYADDLRRLYNDLGVAASCVESTVGQYRDSRRELLSLRNSDKGTTTASAPKTSEATAVDECDPRDDGLVLARVVRSRQQAAARPPHRHQAALHAGAQSRHAAVFAVSYMTDIAGAKPLLRHPTTPAASGSAAPGSRKPRHQRQASPEKQRNATQPGADKRPADDVAAASSVFRDVPRNRRLRGLREMAASSIADEDLSPSATRRAEDDARRQLLHALQERADAARRATAVADGDEHRPAHGRTPGYTDGGPTIRQVFRPTRAPLAAAAAALAASDAEEGGCGFGTLSVVSTSAGAAAKHRKPGLATAHTEISATATSGEPPTKTRAKQVPALPSNFWTEMERGDVDSVGPVQQYFAAASPTAADENESGPMSQMAVTPAAAPVAADQAAQQRTVSSKPRGFGPAMASRPTSAGVLRWASAFRQQRTATAAGASQPQQRRPMSAGSQHRYAKPGDDDGHRGNTSLLVRGTRHGLGADVVEAIPVDDPPSGAAAGRANRPATAAVRRPNPPRPADATTSEHAMGETTVAMSGQAAGRSALRPQTATVRRRVPTDTVRGTAELPTPTQKDDEAMMILPDVGDVILESTGAAA